jgi:hypothetical protein
MDVGGIKNKPKIDYLDDSFSFEEEGNEGGLSPLYQNRPSFASFDPMQYGYEDLQDDKYEAFHDVLIKTPNKKPR